MCLNKNKMVFKGLFFNRNINFNFIYIFDRKINVRLLIGYNFFEWVNKMEIGYGS